MPWFNALSDRLRRVRVCSGDWSRVCGPTPTYLLGRTAVFLDPPYADTAGRDNNLYRTDSLTVAHDVRDWAVEMGQRPDMLIALCGYEGEHDMPDDWDIYKWRAGVGYAGLGNGAGKDNRDRERIWFSPACLRSDKGQGRLL